MAASLRPWGLRAGLGALLLPLWACYGLQPTPQGPEDLSLLEISCEPPDAEIHVDDRYMGTLQQWRGGVVPLKPGAHRVEVSREGFLPYRLDLRAETGRRYHLQLDLIRDVALAPDEEPGGEPDSAKAFPDPGEELP